MGWYLTVGNSADPFLNEFIVTGIGIWPTIGGWVIEVDKNAQYLAIIKFNGTLSLSLVSVFILEELDCKKASISDQVYYI